MSVRRIGCHLFFAGTLACIGIVVSGPVAAEGASESDQAVVEEVIVTARKREERAIDTPVAVSVMNEDDLDLYNTRDLTQLTERIPGLEVIHSGGGGAGGNMTIRGIGKPPGTADYGIDAPVSLVIDGMPFSRNHMILTGFFDSEAVEVLKGPQALYFGKNSPAGVIAIRSKTPDVGAPMEGFVRAQYEFIAEDPVVEAGFSMPLGDQLAIRLAGRRQDMQGGWVENVAEPLDASGLYPGTNYSTRGASYDEYPAQKQSVVRFTAVWEPNERFDATLKMFRSYTKRNDAAATILWSCADGPGANPDAPGHLARPDADLSGPQRQAEAHGSAAAGGGRRSGAAPDGGLPLPLQARSICAYAADEPGSR